VANNRIQRINEDIQRVMATLLREIKDPRINQGIISVTAADTSSDLHYAKIYLSVYGLESEKEFRKGLKSATGFMRRELSRSLNLRHTPELVFEIDKSIERGARISSLLGGLDIPDDADGEGNDEGGIDDRSIVKDSANDADEGEDDDGANDDGDEDDEDDDEDDDGANDDGDEDDEDDEGDGDGR